MHGCLVCMCACCPSRSKEDIGFPGTRVIDGCKPLYGCWEPNLDPLKDKPVPLIAEPSIQPL